MALTKIKTSGIADNAITNAKMADDAIDSADFVDGSIDNAHLAGSIAVSKTLLSAGAGLTLSTNSLSVDADQSGQITQVGTLTGLSVGISAVSKAHIYENTTATDSSAGLTIEQAGTGDAILQFLETGTQRWVMGLDNSDSDKFKISSDGDLNTNARLTIDTSGNVGIGTDSPANKLHVSDAGQNTVMRIGNNGNYDQYIYFNGGNDWCVGMDYSDSNKFKISGHSSFAGIDDFLTIDTSGNVLIGKTATNIATDGVQFGGGANNAITETADTVLYINRKTNDGELIIFRKDNSTIGSVNSRGGEFIAIGYSDTYLEFNAGSNQINPSSGTAARDNLISLGSSGARFDDAFITNGVTTGSDERMKDEIVDSPIGLSFINDLRPVQYKWKDYDDKTFSRKHYGLIAQEVEQVLTDNGMVNNDFAPLIYDEESDRYGMRYSEYVGILIKAIQELSAKVEALENA